MEQLNGIKVTHSKQTQRRNGIAAQTTFIPLPRELWRAIGDYPCACGHCDGRAFWDTLAVSANSEFTWTVHYPELHK